MHRAALFFSWRRAGAVASLWMGLLLGGAAHAALVGSVTVSLIAPGGLTTDSIVTPISVSDTVSPFASAIAAGDATNIGDGRNQRCQKKSKVPGTVDPGRNQRCQEPFIL